MNIYEKTMELRQINKDFVIITVVKSAGSTPGKPGFKMLVDADGNTFGTVGGGAIEKEAANEARRLMASGSENTFKEYILNKDENIIEGDAKVLPMSCCGRASLFYEVEMNASALYIFGGGHVGSALIDIVSNLKYKIVLVDNRKEMLENRNADKIECVYSEYKEYAEKFNPRPGSYFIVVSFGHVYDYDILSTLYKRNLVTKYVGVIASKSKAAEMINNLKTEIREDIDLSMLHTPIGLKIGGDTAYEIALSIAAEIQTVKYGKKVSTVSL